MKTIKSPYKSIVIIVFLCILFPLFALCQKPEISQNLRHKADSIIKILKASKIDTIKLKLLIETGDLYKNILPVTKLNYYNYAYKIAKKTNNPKHIAFCLKNLGYVYSLKGAFKNSLEYLNKAQNIFKKINNKYETVQTYINIGTVYYLQGSYNKSIESYLNAIKICEEINYEKGIADSYVGIGIVFKYQGSNDKAMDYYKKAINIFEKLNNKEGIMSCYTNIGNVLQLEKKYTEAIEYHAKGLNYYIETSDLKGQAVCYNNIGLSYTETGKFINALKCFQQSLKINIERDNKNGITSSYLNISEVFLKIKDYQQAIENVNIGLEFAKKTGSLPRQKFAYSVLYEAYKKINDYKKALEYHELFKKLNDSIYNSEKSKQITEMQTKYETDKKEQEILTKDKDLQIQSLKIGKMNYFIFILIFLVLISTVLGYFVSRKIKLQSKLKNIQLEQKLLQSQMNPHFIFNALSSIQNLIYMNENDTAVEYLAKLAKLIRRILENSRQEYISIDREVTMLQHYMELQSLRFKNKFDFVIETAPALLEETISIPPMLAQPFIENAIEHGIMHKEGKGNIKINFNREDDMLIFEVIDNGVGREKSALLEAKSKRISKHISLATAITEERLANINKSLKKKDKIKISIIDLKDDNGNASGTKVLISIPIIEE